MFLYCNIYRNENKQTTAMYHNTDESPSIKDKVNKKKQAKKHIELLHLYKGQPALTDGVRRVGQE